jgi:5'-AMP-activated protein kinase regulatory beta subunit
VGSPRNEEAFVFNKKQDDRMILQRSSEEESEPYFSKSVPEPEFIKETRKRSNTVSESSGNEKIEITKDGQPALPTVFKWEGGGKNVFISGTFSEWKPLPMVKTHGDFVTIVDLPEGDHEYKFYVDGEWKHDPRLVSTYRLAKVERLPIFYVGTLKIEVTEPK